MVVATDDLSIGKGAVLSGNFGVLLVGSEKKIAKTKFYIRSARRHASLNSTTNLRCQPQ